MKEYRVITPKLGLSKRMEKLEDLLNQYARERWEVKHVAQSAYFIVFEREKNM